VSIALRDVLSGFFAGCVLMMYDVVRAGDIVQFGPASGGPSVEGQYRVLHINLKHSIVVPLDVTSKIGYTSKTGPESSNGLWFVPNSVMLNVRPATHVLF
jgi:small-conductance mechanosensitive channel